MKLFAQWPATRDEERKKSTAWLVLTAKADNNVDKKGYKSQKRYITHNGCSTEVSWI